MFVTVIPVGGFDGLPIVVVAAKHVVSPFCLIFAVAAGGYDIFGPR